jgi:hypothetical protein
MSSPLSPYCCSCGWNHKSIPGKSCKHPRWHKPLPGANEDLIRHSRATIGAYVPNWVAARIRREATKDGKTLGALASELLEAWAKKHGGIP